MSLSKPWLRMGLLCALGLPSAAWAATAPGVVSMLAQQSHRSTQAKAKQVSIDGFGQPVSASALGHYSGGSAVLDNQNLAGTVTGDSATQVTTGTNSITGDSFAGASGLPSVIQNSGNNVLIQNGVIVNLQMKP